MVAELRVREMARHELARRVDYFHDATDEHLARMGVDRARLPDRADWLRTHEQEWGRPLREKTSVFLAWTLDEEVVGFSSADRIAWGEHCWMHLHILDAGRRGRGLGAPLVRRSAEWYLERFELQRVYAEPHACNVAPNRALQRAGFTYVFTHEPEPGPINVAAPMTRWVLERSAVEGT